MSIDVTTKWADKEMKFRSVVGFEVHLDFITTAEDERLIEFSQAKNNYFCFDVSSCLFCRPMT